MTQYVENYNASTMSLSIIGTLPGGVTFDGETLSASGAATASGLKLQVTPL